MELFGRRSRCWRRGLLPGPDGREECDSTKQGSYGKTHAQLSHTNWSVFSSQRAKVPSEWDLIHGLFRNSDSDEVGLMLTSNG